MCDTSEWNILHSATGRHRTGQRDSQMGSTVRVSARPKEDGAHKAGAGVLVVVVAIKGCLTHLFIKLNLSVSSRDLKQMMPNPSASTAIKRDRIWEITRRKTKTSQCSNNNRCL